MGDFDDLLARADQWLGNPKETFVGYELVLKLEAALRGLGDTESAGGDNPTGVDVSPGPVTRDQVRTALAAVTIWMLFPLHPKQLDALADAVMALLESTQPKVLWRGMTLKDLLHGSANSYVPILMVPVGTRVVVIEDTEPDE